MTLYLLDSVNRTGRMGSKYGLPTVFVALFCATNCCLLYYFVGPGFIITRVKQSAGLNDTIRTDNYRRRMTMKRVMFVNPHPDTADSELRFDDCEYSACAMTSSSAEADVLLFNAGRMRDFKLPQRRENQIWVMFSKEPPDLPRFDDLDRDDLINQVNFSRMILSDSTWQNKYGALVRRPLPRKDYKKLFRQKRHPVAWFASQCSRPSRRLEYVKRMRRTVDVHIYGRCGNRTCGAKGYTMGDKKTECLDMLSKNYKFYLSFENTFCRDYVSEKFFNMFEEVDIIPVVRGGADYKRLFPSGIFIDASDFPSPESLGNYLRDLARDEKKYVAMLQEKNRYTKSGYNTSFTCDLCKMAHTGQPRHVYGNFYKWLRAPGNCWDPRDLGPMSVDN